jgi:non-ribosomal peptide synthetase component F/thioesterase domain-containing protein/acyl carrier protein
MAARPDRVLRSPQAPSPAPEPEGLELEPRPLDWNGPVDRPFLPPVPQDLELPIIQQLERVVRRQADRVALSDARSSVSFVQLWESICGLGETIAASTRPGELVGLLLPDGVLHPLAMLACLAAGRPFLALDSHHPREWVEQIVREAAPSLVLVSERSSLTAGTAHIVSLDGVPACASAGWRPAALDVDEPACVLFTSGSTGRPKGVVNSQRALLQRITQSIQAAHINACDRLLTLAPLSTIVGVRDVLTALLAGARMHILDSQRSGAREVLAALRSQATTILFGFPALLRSIVPGDGERADAALRLVRLGGDTTLWADVDRLRAWLHPGAKVQLIYAATEAPIMQWFVDSACRGADPRLPVGYPLPGNSLTVIDEEGRSVPPGEIGELVVGSPFVALGTWREGRVLPGDCASNGAGGRLFRTGDLVRQRPDGLLERLGRRDRQIKIRGVRVDLEGVEAMLRQHPGVRDVGVVTRSRVGGDVSLIGYVSVRDPCGRRSAASTGLLDELAVLMRSAPPAMRPARLLEVDAIPRLQSSKLDVRALQALDDAELRKESVAELRGKGRSYAWRQARASGDRIEAAVAKAWREALQAPPAGSQEDFFSAGGDSLKAIRLVATLERELNVELSLTLVSETPTFEGLCQALTRQRALPRAALILLKPGAGAPPVFFIHGVGGNVAELFAVARSMCYPGPVFGLQARGLRPGERPRTSVEKMAAAYLPEIRAAMADSGGPFHLCGYSFGGLVAFEMARRLRVSGAKIGLVGLLDTRPSPLRWPAHVWLSFAHRWALQLFSRTTAAPRTAQPALQWSFASALSGARGTDTPLPAFLQRVPTRALRVAAGGLMASARYRPSFYPGKLTLFTPLERDPALPDTTEAWRPHARSLLQVTLPGAHLTMLSGPHALTAAATLSRQLETSID